MALSLKPKEQFFWEPQLGTSIGSRYKVLGTSKHGYQATATLGARDVDRVSSYVSCLSCRDTVPSTMPKNIPVMFNNLWKDLSLLSLVWMVNLGLRLELIGPRNVAATEELLKV